MKILLLLIFATLYIHDVLGAMSEAQMKATLKLVRNTCQPKFKATNEQIDAMHAGNWDMETNAQCYLWCIMNMYRLITKDNVFDWEGGVKLINTQAPESIRTTAVPSIENCKDAIKTPTDKCIAAYEVAHCMYLYDPEHYFLP